jgi:dCMP deaminase
MRPSFDDVAIRIAKIIAERSTCLRLHTAAVVCTQDNRIVTTGYNGSLPGQPHCDDFLPCYQCGRSVFYRATDSDMPRCVSCKVPAYVVGCEMANSHCIRTVHAELNAILQAALYGISLKGCKLYALHTPCAPCANAIVQAGIVEVIVDGPYSIDLATDRLTANDVVVRQAASAPPERV